MIVHIIGQVFNPETLRSVQGTRYVKFSLIINRTMETYAVFEKSKDFDTGEVVDNPLFKKALALNHGDNILAELNLIPKRNDTGSMRIASSMLDMKVMKPEDVAFYEMLTSFTETEQVGA